jgi:hypothetical protein
MMPEKERNFRYMSHAVWQKKPAIHANPDGEKWSVERKFLDGWVRHPGPLPCDFKTALRHFRSAPLDRPVRIMYQGILMAVRWEKR